MKTASGKSRLFGFVGFRSQQQAEEAVSYFNNTYIDSSRISVELAKRIGDNDLETTRSKHAKNKARHRHLQYNIPIPAIMIFSRCKFLRRSILLKKRNQEL